MSDITSLESTQLDAESARERLATHWRNSIPSIILAIVSSLLALMYFLWVQPNIQSNYEKIRKERLDRLGDLKLDTLESLVWRTNDEPKIQIGHLEVAQLCTRRLSLWNSDDEKYRFESARISELLSKIFREIAHSLPPSETDSIRNALSRSENENERAIDAMRRLSKNEGLFSSAAKIWIASSALSKSSDLGEDDLLKNILALKTVLANGADPVSCRKALLQYEIIRALRPSSKLSDDERIAILHDTQDLSTSLHKDALKMTNWLALANAIESPAKAKQLAWEASQQYWTLNSTEQSDLEIIVSVFECMLISGGLKESQGFLVRVLEKIPAFEQLSLRQRVADACMRWMVLVSLTDNIGSDTDRLPTLLAMTVQLAPESVELAHLLDRIGFDSQSRWVNHVRTNLIASSDKALKHFVDFLRIGPESSESEIENIAKSLTSMGTYAIVASRYAVRRVAKSPNLLEKFIRFLTTMNRQNPDLLVIWSDRASLHVSAQQYDAALECYKFLQSKLPENLEIKDAIEQLKLKLR